jgi:hypothetical protein
MTSIFHKRHELLLCKHEMHWARRRLKSLFDTDQMAFEYFF